MDSSLNIIDVHKWMSLHICGIVIGIEMCVFICVFSLRMAKHMLGDAGSGHTV